MSYVFIGKASLHLKNCFQGFSNTFFPLHPHPGNERKKKSKTTQPKIDKSPAAIICRRVRYVTASPKAMCGTLNCQRTETNQIDERVDRWSVGI